jgi:molybdenum cofactor guanylyltransferase
MKPDQLRASYRPADICRALLAALEAAEGRRRSRKRDQTPDAFGLAVKRDLLQRVVNDDPDPNDFEAWLIDYPNTCGARELAGPARAMARAVFDDWRLAHNSAEFKRWLDDGAPSADASSGRASSPGTQAVTSNAATATQNAAIILAGGRSSRMGRAKALLPFDGQPLIAHLVTTLQARFAEIVVVAAPGEELPALPVTVVRDQVAHQGPVGGLCYGLSAIASDAAFVTSCDAAFLDTRLIEYLMAQLPGHDVVVPHWEGRPQPLHAVYRKSVVPLLQAQLAHGELRPVYLFEKVPTCHVGEEDIRGIDPEGWSFFNMNTPEDYARALERWRALRPEAAPIRLQCTVELFGAARLVAKTTEVELSLPQDARLSHALDALSEQLPALVGKVVTKDRNGLIDGYACSVNGRSFARSFDAPVQPGDHLIILSADAGG